MDKDFCHVGLIVPKLEPAIEELTKVMRCEWRPTYEGGLSLHQPGVGYRDVRMRIACSIQQPFLEVIEAVPGTPWALSESGSNLHHIAFYTDDLDAACKTWQAVSVPSRSAGWPGMAGCRRRSPTTRRADCVSSSWPAITPQTPSADLW